MSAPLKIIWTKEEDDHFLSLVLQGYQIGKIAESVGRARSTVGLHIKDLIPLQDERQKVIVFFLRPNYLERCAHLPPPFLVVIE